MNRSPKEIVKFLLKVITRIWQYRVIPKIIKSLDSVGYWSHHTVPTNSRIKSELDSVKFFIWRCDQYPGYLKLMPVDKCKNQIILDFGCGPGQDLAGLLYFGQPKEILAADVSRKAIDIAKRRISFHTNGQSCKFLLIEDGKTPQLPQNYFDYIHSSGVLHHIQELQPVLQSLKDALKEDGFMRVMVYNQNSLWYHLYAPYVLQIKRKLLPKNLDSDTAFRMSTDGPMCPVANAFTFDSFSELAQEAGFLTSFVGTSLSMHEISMYQKYGQVAKSDMRLALKHREFLQKIQGNDEKLLLPDGTPPGVNLVLELRKKK